MINSERDYSEEIANLCRQYNVKYLGLHGSSYDQENAATEDAEINFLVEFFPMEPKQYGMCYFGLEKELQDMFGPHAGLCDLTGITHPDILRPLTKRKTDIYKASQSEFGD
jgi:predicted nucleotidyltransferase